jgi:hypothetical protein
MSNPNLNTDQGLRADIDAAFDEAEKTSNDSNTQGTPEPELQANDPSDDQPATDEPTAEGSADAPTAGSEQSVAPAEGAAPAPAAPEAAAPPPAPESNEPTAKAPGTWTPAAREKWATLPSEVKTEVWKREREASRALTMSNEARKFQNEFSNTMQPFLGFIAAENSTPLQAVQHMMQTAAALRVGTPQQKVQIAADIIQNFGIDLRALDSVLAGQRPEFNPQTQIQQLIQRELQPVMQTFQQQRQLIQQQEANFEQEVSTELERFAADPKHEFYWDVKDIMADLMEVSSRRGEAMDLTAAYERAIMMHDPVRRVIEARKTREAAQRGNQLAQRAKQTSSLSVTPSAQLSTVTPVAGDSLRDSIEAAIDAQQGR